MEDETPDLTEQLSRRQASDAVTGLGWRYVLGMLKAVTPRSCVPFAGLTGRVSFLAACPG